MLVAVIVAVPTYWFALSVVMERWPVPLSGMWWQRSAAVLIAFVVAAVVLAATDLVFQ